MGVPLSSRQIELGPHGEGIQGFCGVSSITAGSDKNKY